MQWCSKCRRYRQQRFFRMNLGRRTGYQAYCNDCDNVHNRERKSRGRWRKHAQALGIPV